MLSSGCRQLDGILYTHEHADHTAGLDDIRPYNFMQKAAMPLYAHPRVLENLSRRFDYAFADENRYPGAPAVKPVAVSPGTSFELGSLTVTPIDMLHGDLQVFGYRIGDFAYLTDIKSIHPNEVAKLQNLKVLVVSALREEPHHSHFNLEEALDFIAQVNPASAYLTHIGHTFGFHADIEKKLPPQVHVAYDNLILEL